MIILGLGANLDSPAGGPRDTLEAALAALASGGVRVRALSRWYETAPVPPSGQPWFTNAVAILETGLAAPPLLGLLQDVERRFGRRRGLDRNAARSIDLDLLAYGDLVIRTAELELPHPRLHERAFVLVPLADLAPNWRHPVRGETVETMLAALPGGATEVAGT